MLGISMLRVGKRNPQENVQQRTKMSATKPRASLRVCVVLPAFPVAGGMRSVLARIALVTSDSWQIEYLPQYVGPNSEGLTIHRFGTRRMAPWQFPAIWLYCFAGFCKLMSLLL